MDTLNAEAGAATKALNDAKKKEEERVVATKDAEAATIKAKAHKTVEEANEKRAASEAMLNKIDNALCSKHPGCSGLTGYCCPTLDTSKMKLGSTKLDGAVLGCCGAAIEVATETVVKMATSDPKPAQSQSFGVVSILLAAVSGSAVTAMVFKFSSDKGETNTPYERLVTA